MKSADEMREHLCAKAAEDQDFRARLLASPKATIQQELSVDIPEIFAIEVHEDGPTSAHLVLPPAAQLDEADLRAAQGGWNSSSSESSEPAPSEPYGTAYQPTDSGPYGRA